MIANLLPLLTVPETRAETANALAQALRGTPLDGVSPGAQEQAALDALIAAGASGFGDRIPGALVAIARSIGRLPFARPEQAVAAEAFLRRVLETPFPLTNDEPHAGAARGLESLARRQRKTHTLDEDTVTRLRGMARRLDPRRAEHQRNALAALIASQGVDELTLQTVLGAADQEVRRLAVLALAGSGSGAAFPEEMRLQRIRDLLGDSAQMVRIEAVRAWVRRGAPEHGCAPLLERLTDPSVHVVLAVLDALGDACPQDEGVTARLITEARADIVPGHWQRPAHALVSLAKRAPERAAQRLPSFAAHVTWQVRMYATRAAALLEDAEVLRRLAEDPVDSVAEAALFPLRKLAGSSSDDVFVAALGRQNRRAGMHEIRPFQVVRAAAIALENAAPSGALVEALAAALERITEEDCETSRDIRLALIVRLAELGTRDQASRLTPLLKDPDPVIAGAAARAIGTWTGSPVATDVRPRRARSFSLPDLTDSASVLVEMESGKTFEIRFNQLALAAKAQFLFLVRKGYYDNLTFHRIVPNFVIQGGSPNSHEYCGYCPFARDELSLAMNRRGSIGISTRGRDTGDAQIFINLVDNPRLDHEYTIFAYVCQDSAKDGMDVVDGIQEGDRMSRLRVIRPGRTCR